MNALPFKSFTFLTFFLRFRVVHIHNQNPKSYLFLAKPSNTFQLTFGKKWIFLTFTESNQSEHSEKKRNYISKKITKNIATLTYILLEQKQMHFGVLKINKESQ